MRGRPSSKAEKVWLGAVGLQNFRNYDSLNLDLDQRHVVLFGDNGAGKTNILEAISLLSPGRGLRRATYQKMTRIGTQTRPETGAGDDHGWSVTTLVRRGDDETRIGTGLKANEGGQWQRRTRVDSAPLRATESLLDIIRVIWLVPAMDGLFAGPAGDRRRFLDRMVLAIDPRHGRRVADYERAMRGRNRLLADERSDPAWLAGIEQQMAELGVAIAAARGELIACLRETIARAPARAGAFPQTRLALAGEAGAHAGDVALDMEDQMRDELARGRARDRAAGRTLSGPHRDDLEVVHDGNDMAADRCSTGEQKALLIGLVLAHARLICDLAGQIPVILLDEVAAHLDAGRRAGLFEQLHDIGCQAWMTGTEWGPFAALGGAAQAVEITDGIANPVQSA
jgi:DNA replication and repair protein RecF